MTLTQLLIIAGVAAFAAIGAAWYSVKKWERDDRADRLRMQQRPKIAVGRRTRHEGDDAG